MAPPSRKRARPEDGDDDEENDEPSWERVMRPTTGELARHALVLGMECLEGQAFEALDDLARRFFRSAGNDMSDTLLMPSGDENVVSLSIARPMAERTEAERAKRLAALAMAAESEAGQSVRGGRHSSPPSPPPPPLPLTVPVRRSCATALSVPASHVGVRRTLL